MYGVQGLDRRVCLCELRLMIVFDIQVRLESWTWPSTDEHWPIQYALSPRAHDLRICNGLNCLDMTIEHFSVSPCRSKLLVLSLSPKPRRQRWNIGRLECIGPHVECVCVVRRALFSLYTFRYGRGLSAFCILHFCTPQSRAVLVAWSRYGLP